MNKNLDLSVIVNEGDHSKTHIVHAKNIVRPNKIIKKSRQINQLNNPASNPNYNDGMTTVIYHDKPD